VLDILDWGGFIGQWDDREWSGTNLDVDHAKYGNMTGLKQGFIKRADLAWYCDHHHDANGKNVAYAYSYLFGYAIDLPPGTKSIKLPQNEKVRILAMSVADDGPKVTAAEPLYDVLPSPDAQPGGINYSGSLPAATMTATRAD
jgi:alpha-mannosidase